MNGPGLLHVGPFGKEWPYLLAVFTAAFATYLSTMPRTVTLEDSGELIMACRFAGIAHPPGYPLYTMLGKLFTLLPFGSVAFRVHLLSAAFGAGTCSILWCILRMLIPGRRAACTGALAYGFSRMFWSQAIIAEVYTLNTFLFFSMLLAALAFARDGGVKQLAWVAFLCGLGLSHHWPLFVLSLPCVALILVAAPRRKATLRSVPTASVCFVAGLLPYAYLVLRSGTDPLISFCGPVNSLERFLYLVGRGPYSGAIDTSVTSWADKWRFIGFLLRETSVQYTTAGAALVVLGAMCQWKRLPKLISVALCLGFLGNTLFLLPLLNLNYEFYKRITLSVYPLIPYAVAGIWLVVGLDVLCAWILNRTKTKGAIMCLVLNCMIVVGVFLAHLPINDRQDYVWARDFASVLLNSLDEDAVLFTHDDRDTGPVGYLHYVEGVRPDVTVMNGRGLLFRNRLFVPPVSTSEEEQAVSQFIRADARPIYHTGPLANPYGDVDYGLYRKVERTLQPGTRTFALPTELEAYCRTILDDRTQIDAWTVDHRNLYLAEFARVLTGLIQADAGNDANNDRISLLNSITSNHFHSLAMMIEWQMAHESPAHLLELSQKAESLLNDTVSKRDHGRLFYVRGNILLRLNGNHLNEDIVSCFEQALRIHADPTNEALPVLLRAYATRGEQAKADLLRVMFNKR